MSKIGARTVGIGGIVAILVAIDEFAIGSSTDLELIRFSVGWVDFVTHTAKASAFAKCVTTSWMRSAETLINEIQQVGLIADQSTFVVEIDQINVIDVVVVSQTEVHKINAGFRRDVSERREQVKHSCFELTDT